MPVEHSKRGDGMDERTVRTVKLSKPATTEEACAAIAMLRSAADRNDPERLLLAIERQAKWTIGHRCGQGCRGHHEPNEMQRADAELLVSHAWDGREGGTGLIDLIRNACARGNVGEAVAFSLQAGAISESLRLRLTWGLDATAGRRSRGQGTRGREGGRPAVKSRALDEWLKSREAHIRAKAQRRSRRGLALLVKLDLPPRMKASSRLVEAALTRLLGRVRKP